MVDLTQKAGSKPERILVHGLCGALNDLSRRACVTKRLFVNWVWGESAPPMSFVDRPQVNFGPWPGRSPASPITSDCVMRVKPRPRHKMNHAQRAAFHFGSR